MATGDSITQAYGFCFTADGLVVLVELDRFGWILPGGRPEPGESPRAALDREVAEEACARVTDAVHLARQHVCDPDARSGPTSYYQTRWWARVELDPWIAADDTRQRVLVPPDQVLEDAGLVEHPHRRPALDLAVGVDQKRVG